MTRLLTRNQRGWSCERPVLVKPGGRDTEHCHRGALCRHNRPSSRGADFALWGHSLGFRAVCAGTRTTQTGPRARALRPRVPSSVTPRPGEHVRSHPARARSHTERPPATNSAGAAIPPAMRPMDILHDTGARTVTVTWDDGERSVYPVAYLRGWCPCATCQGHSNVVKYQPAADTPSRRCGRSGRTPGLRFSDGHDKGIFHRAGCVRSALVPHLRA